MWLYRRDLLPVQSGSADSCWRNIVFKYSLVLFYSVILFYGLQAFQELSACMVETGKIKADYELYGHRQTKPPGGTECPGDRLYDIIQTWPHWVRGHQLPVTEMAIDTLKSAAYPTHYTF